VGNFTEFRLLMELSRGGHVVKLMNERIENRFTESEVLAIFSDTCKGLVMMRVLTHFCLNF
jgi:AP2-associated kinase